VTDLVDPLLPPGARPVPNTPDDTGVASRNGHHPPRQDAPPHDLQAERSLLGAAMLGNAGPLLELPEAAFYKPGHGHIAHAIRTLAGAGSYIDSLTVRAHLEAQGLLDQAGGPVLLAEILAECPAASGAPTYADIVRDHWRARTLAYAGEELLRTVRTQGPDAAYALLGPLLDAGAPTRRSDRLKPGSWLLDSPATPPAIWGRDHEVLWAAGEPCLLTGPPGVGKTTLCAQLLRARLGLDDQVLGWPVQPEDRGGVLYLASDRPQQIRRALARVFTTADRQILDDQLQIWTGPPPGDLAKNTSLLVELAQRAGAHTVVLDSLKDMAIGLSDDEVGAGLNQAMQLAIANDIDVLALHHQRKGTDGKRPKTLEDLYGSTWISAGAGSVLLLWGAAGDSIVELHHLKQPASDVGPLKVEHDHHTGATTVFKGFDIVAYLRHRPNGVTATDVARAWLEKDKPTDNERKKAQRRLENLVRLGQAHKVQTDTRQPDGTVAPARFYPIDTRHPDPDQPPLHDLEPPPDEPTDDTPPVPFEEEF